MRTQGLAMLLDARARLEQGETPLAAAFDGLCLAAAGILLVLPGFITDAMAGLLLLPPIRRLLLIWVASRLVVVGAGRGHQGGHGPADPTIIETEYHVVDAEPPASEHKRLEP
ncbi:MAG: FxsA family protein [Magnetospirillum sp.]|nr:FxsA family protein [Magnetospirillum sp.]